MADAVSLSFSPSYVVQRNRRVKKKKKKNVPLHRRAEFRRHTLTVFATNLAEKKKKKTKRFCHISCLPKKKRKKERREADDRTQPIGEPTMTLQEFVPHVFSLYTYNLMLFLYII